MKEIERKSIENININDMHSFFGSIDSVIIRKVFIETSKECSSKSKFYIGKKGNGKFWNGFRINSITIEKIINAILNIIYNGEKEDFDIVNFMRNLLETNYGIDVNEIDEEIISNIKNKDEMKIVCQILNISIPDEATILRTINKKQIDEIEKIKEENRKKIQDLNEKIQIQYDDNKKEKNKLKEQNEVLNSKSAELIKKIDELNNEIKDKDKKIKELIKEKNETNKLLDKQKILCENSAKERNELVNQIIRKVNLTDNEYNKIVKNESSLSKCNIDRIIKELLRANIERYYNNDDISELLIFEYALIKIRESENNGAKRDTRAKREI